ncbi:MAG: hypothetical protein IKZ87_04550 [Actinomycetaceae bacterium]|nr:hypothetical protein [Actinomycetaceae bacterium]
MFGDVIKMVIPILIAFALGLMMRKTRLISQEGSNAIKTVVSKIMLPVILINAFMFADYDSSVILTMTVIFVAMLVVFGAGYLFSKLMPQRAKYMPFLFTTLECGTLGYPLAAMLFGDSGTSKLAIIDVGHTIFLFLVAVPLLQAVDGGKADPKSIAKNAIASPTFDAMILGIILGVSGVDNLLVESSSYGLYQSIVSFISAPTGMLILLTLGYDMAIKKDIIKPVLFTSISRLVLMGALCAVTCLIIFQFTPYSKEQLVIIILAFILPASYGLTTFAKFEGHNDYVATTVSFSTILTLLLFVGLAVFALA